MRVILSVPLMMMMNTGRWVGRVGLELFTLSSRVSTSFHSGGGSGGGDGGGAMAAVGGVSLS